MPTPEPPATGRTVVGLGEALFDVYPDETRLGGAPLNMAVHARQLGNRGVIVSRVGQDELGHRVITELKSRGVVTRHLQTDPDRPTGTVVVKLDPAGEPHYRIVKNVAWDAIQWDPDLDDVARRADAVCFGTLAQRDGQSRSTIYRFLESATTAVRLLDVNLRQDFYDRRVLGRSLELADALKLNTREIQVLADLFSLGHHSDDAVAALLDRYGFQWIALTRGKLGTVVYTPGGRHETAPVPLSGAIDAVGAGDATAAALLHGALRHWPWERTLTLANTLGAYVASRPGACPELSEDIQRLAAGEAGGEAAAAAV